MRFWWIGIALPAFLACVGLAALGVWLSRDWAGPMELRTPGLDRLNGPLVVLQEAKTAVRPGQPIRSDGVPSNLSGQWPGFRGLERDGICRESVRLAQRWPTGGPPVLWQIPLGPGHAGAAVAQGRVFVLDYDVAAQADTLRCLSLDDGREIWRNSYPVEVPENHGSSRTVPAVWKDTVVTFGPKCHVAGWDVQTGRCLWLVDLVGQYGAKVPPWYAGQCPLVEQGRVILAPCGDLFMLALDCRTGSVLWQTPKVSTWDMTHVSVVPMEFAGRRMYVYCGSGGIAGVSAEDGRLLWQSTAWVGKMATCPSPVPVGDGRLFCTGGYGAGSVLLQLEEQNGRFNVRVLRRWTPRQFGAEHHTPIFYQGHLYGIRCSPAPDQLVCFDLEGQERWNSGPDRFGRGPLLLADGKLYVLSERGLLVMVEATPEAYRPLARFQAIPDAQDAWGPLALAGGRLILRDLTRMVCLDIAAQ